MSGIFPEKSTPADGAETPDQVDALDTSPGAQGVGRECASAVLLQAITEAADEAPTVEDALRAALARICAHTGWQAGRLQFSADAGDLANRTFWHLEDPERLSTYRAFAQTRRVSPPPGPPNPGLQGKNPMGGAFPKAPGTPTGAARPPPGPPAPSASPRC